MIETSLLLVYFLEEVMLVEGGYYVLSQRTFVREEKVGEVEGTAMPEF